MGLNLAGVTFFISILIFGIVAFPNEFKGEKEVREQINQEYSILNKEYQPVLDYLKNYKKEYGIYPDSIDEKIIPKSDSFDMYKYHTTYNGKGYWLQVYPKNPPIEYYYNDENDKNVNYYDGDGYIDGALDNDYFYKIDEKWHAIMLQHLTRHSLLWNGGQTEREVDEWMKRFSFIIFIFLFIGLCYYSLFIEPDKLEVNHYTLQDTELNGIKIVFASDFHIKPHQQKRLEKVVELINLENPDLVLSVGDYVSGHSENMTMPIEDITKELSKVKSKYGFYTTLGNHDGWYGADYIAKSLEKNGIKVLANENISIPINSKTVYIAGVEDLMTGKPDIYKALENTKTPVILLTHTPDIFPKLQYSVNLVLAGHTHGGQVRLPLLGPIFTASSYGDKYSKGLTVAKNGNKMITTKGIGTSILPIRFNCVPEIIVIEFE